MKSSTPFTQRIQSSRNKVHAWNGASTACNTYRPRPMYLSDLTLAPPETPLSCNMCIAVLNARSLRTLRNVTGALRKAGLVRTPR